MANVIVTVADRPYTMQCPDGEEEHLKELAQLLDGEVARIKASVGSIGDIRLLVMSGLMVADRLSEAITKIDSLESQINEMREARDHALKQVRTLETNLTGALERAAGRLESLAKAIDG